MKKLMIVALALVLPVAVGCGRPARLQNSAKPEERGLPVAVASVELAAMAQSVPVAGTLKALRDTALSAQVSARVVDVKVLDGDAVTKGQVLVVLDQTDIATQVDQASASARAAEAQLRAAQSRLVILEQGARSEERSIARSQLEQAEAALRNAQLELDRRRRLFDQGGVSREELDAAQTAYDTARTSREAAKQSLDMIEKGARPEEIDAARQEVEAAAANERQGRAALAHAEEMLGYTLIRAPLTGVIYDKNVQQGEVVFPGGGLPLLRIADLKAIYFEGTVSGRLAPQVHAGQIVQVNVHGDKGTSVQGKVLNLVAVADPSSREFLVRIAVPEVPGIFRPGVYSDGFIIVEQRSNTLVVPKDALVERGGGTAVFVVENKQAIERPVKVGLTDRTHAEIISGLKLGETVVTEGAQALKNGDPVMVEPGGGK